MLRPRVGGLRALLLAVWLLPCTPAAPAVSSPTPAAASLASVERRVWEGVNQYREARGLPRLEWDEDLARIARAHSRAMAAGKASFGHAGFPLRASEAELSSLFTSAAENVALNNRDGAAGVATAVEAWVRSPGHRANIEGAYSFTGVGVARSSKGVYYFTQIFLGLPMNGEPVGGP